MIKPKQFSMQTINKEWVSDQVVKVDFMVLDFPGFSFEPGQHINLKIDDKTVRPYSIYSDLENSDEISIVVSAAHEGVGADYLKSLKVNDQVTAVGPAGKLALPNKLKGNLVFLATGTGIVPFMTMFYKLAKDKCESNIKVYFGVRDRADIFFRDELEKFKEKLPNFDYEICLSNPKKSWEDCLGYVTEAFEVDNSGDTQYYVCGVPAMVKDVTNTLKENGVPDEDIIK